jgi:hypothetical protein
MEEMNNPTHALSSFLKTLPANESGISDDSRLKILELLKECWRFLKGSDEHKTFSNKMSRAENLQWNPPVLSFQLERHGATVNGSSRADVHYWDVDIDEGTATIVKTGRRQISKMDSRMDINAKTDEIASNILDGLDHPSLNWDNKRETVVITIGQIIPETISQTTQSRRKRFRDRLETIMCEQGWIRKDKGNKLGFTKVIAQAE